MTKVVHYVSEDGADPFDIWFGNLSSEARARVQTRIDRVELGNFGDHRSVGEGVRELRIDFGPGYRVYYARDGEILVTCWAAGPRNVKPVTSRGLRHTGKRTNRRNRMPIREHKASQYLKTPQDIAAYLNAAIEEMDNDPRLLMKAFRNVAEAQGGVSEIARQARLDRVALSRALSGRRNPRIDTLAKLSAACGIKLRFSA